MLTDEQLAEMERLADAATPGPWTLDDDGSTVHHDGALIADVYQASDFGCLDPEDDPEGYANAVREGEANAAHIASCSPDRIKALIAEVRRLRAEVERMRPVVEAAAVFVDVSGNGVVAAIAALDKAVDAYRASQPTDSRPTDGAKGEG